jgi:hypothetical protein
VLEDLAGAYHEWPLVVIDLVAGRPRAIDLYGLALVGYDSVLWLRPRRSELVNCLADLLGVEALRRTWAVD